MNKKEFKKNKDFYDKYIKDNRTEDEIMMDIIHENAKKSNKELDITKYEEEIRKQHKKELIIEIMFNITSIIVWILIGVMIGVIWVK